MNDLVKVLTALGERFGAGAVQHQPSTGKVFIDMPLENGDNFPAGLTWQQARYLAFNPQIRGEDLRDGTLPSDWPQESRKEQGL